MARKTKQQAQETRQHILDVALRLFSRQGVSATSLADIAQAAGVTRGAIYWHFKNKLDLVSAVHEHFHLHILGTLQEELESTSTPPLERVCNTWRKFLHGIATNQMYRKVITIFMLKCDYSGELAGLLEQKAEDAAKEFECIKSTLLASMQGYNPATAIEFGRKVLFSTDRPTFIELESHVKGKK